MDNFGNVIRNLMQDVHSRMVLNASSLASEMRREGMTRDQVEEMLYAEGFEQDIIEEAMSSLPQKKGN